MTNRIDIGDGRYIQSRPLQPHVVWEEPPKLTLIEIIRQLLCGAMILLVLLGMLLSGWAVVLFIDYGECIVDHGTHVVYSIEYGCGGE